MNRVFSGLVGCLVGLLTLVTAEAFDGLTRIPLTEGVGVIDGPESGLVYFLQSGTHSYEPARVTLIDGSVVEAERSEPVLIAVFQELRAVGWRFKGLAPGTKLRLEKGGRRDGFWDQIITVEPHLVADGPGLRIAETGVFGGALPEHVRDILTADTNWRQQKSSRTDPIIAEGLDRELSWPELEAAALPLDFQKVLLASPHDSSPGFAFQNGQWLTTWPAHDLPGVTKEDHWFAPGLLINGELIRPAPLSARTNWHRTPDERTLPLWTLEWAHGAIRVRQELFSHRNEQGDAQVVVEFQIENAPKDLRLAIGMGRRPNVHYWDDRSFERTPLPFLTLDPRYEREGRQVRDAQGHGVFAASSDFALRALGPAEMAAVFELDATGRVLIVTPQTPQSSDRIFADEISFRRWRDANVKQWTAHLTAGTQVRLPSKAWMERIDLWRAQVEAITRVHYQGKDRLSYGAYFYQYYFGIEEGWPVMALAYWGDGKEAQRQAEIMLEAENLSKDNVHHQSRNGAAPFAAATVARLTRDRAWLEKIAPALLESAEWTKRVRRENDTERSHLTRGLLPAHIYGGDIRDPATSLYATTACWRGLIETAAVFEELGSPERVAQAKELRAEANALRARISEVIAAVTLHDTSPPFLPLALELPSLGGKNEGPYEALTHSRLGNYWNLFAPSFLELRFVVTGDRAVPSRRIFDYAQRHGGLWAGLPRFYDGLDAAYAVGNISYLLDRSVENIRFRPQALTSLQAFFLHAASRNGATIPEVAGLLPYRFDAGAYEQLVRESPWNFGMYDAERYLQGHISFTEPLGAGAGEALQLIRNALVSETRDGDGLPDGGLILLPAVPAPWFAEGEEIVLENFPTAYGILSATIRSHLESRREIVLEHRFTPFDDGSRLPLKFRVRFTPPGKPPTELSFDPRNPGPVRANY